MKKQSQNLKDGKFTKKELELYDYSKKEIKIIMDYQKTLPILQCNIGDEEEKTVDARELHNQMKVSKAFATWIKTNLENLGAEENQDFKVNSFKGKNPLGGRPTEEYQLTLDIAKAIAMTVGITPRINKETKQLSQLTRKYFILIEKGFKQRVRWNRERDFSIQMCQELKRPLYNMRKDLEKCIPDWFKGNVFSFEFNLLNKICIGMSATVYRRKNNLTQYEPIRNTFGKEMLIIVHRLEQYDAILLEVEKRLNWEEREPLLSEYYKTIMNNYKK